MRTIQMTLDDDLVRAVDRVSKELRTSRSAFTMPPYKNNWGMIRRVGFHTRPGGPPVAYKMLPYKNNWGYDS